METENRKEKKILRGMLIRAAVILVIYLLLEICLVHSTGNDFTEEILNAVISSGQGYEPEDIEIRMSETGILSVDQVISKDGHLYLTLSEMAPGEVMIDILEAGTGRLLESRFYRTAADGLVTDLNNGNFSNFRMSQLGMIFLTAATAFLLWESFFRLQRELRYSYEAIFCIGFGIWVTILTILMLYGYFSGMDMLNIYGILRRGADLFIEITFPLMLIFAVMMTVSNISLIRHEGFRVQNALGILISLVIVAGPLLIWGIDNLFTSGSEWKMDMIASVLNCLYCAYALFECFLQGSIVCGSIAAKNRPAYDKDYIIILGCMIRKDGSLYPLIRGRVDRAVSFYREQLQNTGKKAYFIPSGGKGRNEPVAEAEAMRRYLLEQGIEEERILPEDRSVNTRQNMLFSRELILGRNEGNKAVFSTTNYHVFRSGIISRQAGFYEAEGIGSPTKWYFWPNAYMREVLGMISYKWKTLILLLIPVVAFFTVVQIMF